MKKAILVLMINAIGILLLIACNCRDSKGNFLNEKEGASDMNWRYAYDGGGRIKEITGPGKRTVKIFYEDNEDTGVTRSITRVDPEGDKVVYTMDELGRCVKMADQAGSVDYTYEKGSRLLEVLREGNPGISYTYDAMGRIISLSVGDSENMMLFYSYDFLGRLSTITTSKGEITFDYQTGSNRVIRTMPDNIRTVLDYRADGKLKEITHVAADNKVLRKFSYDYRLDGLIKQVIEWTNRGERKIEYEYDEVHRLVKVTDSLHGKTEYVYDKLGNRISVKIDGQEKDISEYDWAGKITKLNGKACQYDGAYNLVNYGDEALMQFEYDMLNSLKTATNNGVNVSYKYDGDGYLLSREEQSSETRFVTDPMSDAWRPLLVQDANGKETLYVWNGDTPVMSISGNEVQYFLNDHLGSVRAVADRKGTIVESCDYSPFGVPQQTASSGGLQPGFAGLFYDRTAGLYITAARAYDPQTGRFLQTDPQFRAPTGSQKDFSPYVYCGNDPVNYTDRNGAQAEAEPKEVTKDDIEGMIEEMVKYLHRSDVSSGKSFRMMNINPFDAQTSRYYKCWEYQTVIYALLRTNKDVMRDWEVIPAEQVAVLPFEVVFGNNAYIVIGKKSDKNEKYKIDIWNMTQRLDLDPHNWAGEVSKLQPITESYLMNFGYPDWRSDEMYEKIRTSSFEDFIKYYFPRKIGIPGWIEKIEQMNKVTIWDTDELLTYVTNSGHIISGRFSTKTRVYNTNGGMTRRTISHSHYTDSYNGAAVSAAVERYNKTGKWEYPTKTLKETAGKSKSTSTLTNVKTEKPKPPKRKDNDVVPDSLYHDGGDDGGGPPGPPGGGGDIGSSQQGTQSSGINQQRLQESRNIANTMMKQIDLDRSIISRHDISGGSGRVASLAGGGYASSGAEAAVREKNALRASHVGGVYLQGAGEALKTLGQLTGIALDDNGRLILLSEGGSSIGLPSLNMDDIVIVFRSVYETGGPYVSIDPDPKNPHGPTMLVRHDEGTKGTHVGWVLFEADRVMKAYSLGADNVTHGKVTSNVQGYQSMFDMGFSNVSNGNQDRLWERFWIVPAEVKSEQSTDKKLSIYDIPLKVNTQSMVLKKGVLEPAKGKEPSVAAKTFSAWFTKNYDRIALEAMSDPVKDSDMQESTAIYAELRNIALLTAVAENLRDQGVPMPAWMRNYSVKPFPVPTTTPSLTLERTKTETQQSVKASATKTVQSTLAQRIYGGVNLSAEDKDIHVVKGSAEAENLAKAVSRKISSVPSLTPVAINANGKTYQAVALPGEETTDLGANQILETDLTVPLLQGDSISLTRVCNSFFRPVESWGKGWTMDLPYLKKVLQPIKRVGDKSEYQTTYQLVSPLGSCSESFKEIKFVKEVNGNIMVPQNSGSILGLAETNVKEIGEQTMKIISRDGTQWHFDSGGYLAAQISGPAMVIYRWDRNRRLVRIEGWYGKKLLADILMAYDKQGRMISAKGSNKSEVTYAYDDVSGELKRVTRKVGLTEYAYEKGLVTSVKTDGVETGRYAYDNQGRLMQERTAQGELKNFVYGGGKVTSTAGNTSEISEYDGLMRPIKRQYSDGTLVQWQYPEDDTVITSVMTEGEAYYHVISTESGRHEDWLLSNGRAWSADYDDAGRVTAVKDGDRMIMQQEWYPDGLLGVASYESFAMRPQYNEKSVLESTLITPPGNQQQFKEWVQIKYNEAGYPYTITDYSGDETRIGYAKDGQPTVIASKQGTIEMSYDHDGRLETFKTSWGNEQNYDYEDETGMVKKMSFAAEGQKAAIEYKNGSPILIEQYDGGSYRFEYDDLSDSRLKRMLTPNNVEIKYGYDADGRVERVHCDGIYGVKFDYDNEGRLIEISRVPLL